METPKRVDLFFVSLMGVFTPWIKKQINVNPRNRHRQPSTDGGSNNTFSQCDFIYPMFVMERQTQLQKQKSMPNIFLLLIDKLLEEM
jgi:delta-aminolevulinic acid dehydratase/porphobilinogen synthase